MSISIKPSISSDKWLATINKEENITVYWKFQKLIKSRCSYSFYKITFPLASSIWNKYKLFIVPIESKKFIDYKFKWAVNSELGYYKVST